MAAHDDLAGTSAELRPALSAADLGSEPLEAVAAWIAAARAGGLVEPDAMVLATVDAGGLPAARAVLCRGIDERGLRFFTNHRSDKARHLARQPACSLAFVWPALSRQVRITGRAERTSDAESAAYFATRPRGSRLGAWASPQSQVITGREVLERRMEELQRIHQGSDDIPLPPFWGGYVVAPETVEFWQGRPDRLHDRLRYVRIQASGAWRVERLAP